VKIGEACAWSRLPTEEAQRACVELALSSVLKFTRHPDPPNELGASLIVYAWCIPPSLDGPAQIIGTVPALFWCN
jgi:hypothetical protein